jgi:hypothetical protein
VREGTFATAIDNVSARGKSSKFPLVVAHSFVGHVIRRTLQTPRILGKMARIAEQASLNARTKNCRLHKR